jgi:two-component system response regulator YesN
LYKAIVVDDERNIRERLMNFFPWSDAGFQVVGAAENGRKALELMNQDFPHVILTDILMPEMTGLELAKEVKELSPETKVVVLSAYDDFKYAQDAIQYGVKGYILKPLTKEGFLEVFKKLAEELKHDSELNQDHLVNVKWNHDELMLLDLIKGVNSEKYIDRWKNQYSRVVIYSFDQMFKEESTFSIRQMITQNAVNYWKGCGVPILFYGNNLILLLNDQNPISKYDLQPKILQFSNSLKDYFRISHEIESEFIVGVGNLARNIHQISQSYNEAVYAYSYRYFSDNDTIIFNQDLHSTKVSNDEKGQVFERLSDIETELIESVSTHQIPEVSIKVTEFFEMLKQSRGFQVHEIRSACSELVLMIMLRAKEKGQLLPSIDNKYVLSKIYDIESLSELKRWLKHMLETISYDLTMNKEQDRNRYVLLAKEYVNTHFGEKITLEEMANILFLHHAYFSSMFKKETGQNFVDYINEVRVQKASELLKKTDYKIKDISSMVGFHSHSYFNKVFKKLTGVKPLLYRKQMVP